MRRGGWVGLNCGKGRKRSVAGAPAEPTEGGAIFRRDGLLSTACEEIFRRAGALRGLRSPPEAGRPSYGGGKLLR